MTRAVDIHPQSGNAQGIDMATLLKHTTAHPSLASGTSHSGVVDGGNAAGSPGASLGTGSNADLYTPGIEAV